MCQMKTNLSLHSIFLTILFLILPLSVCITGCSSKRSENESTNDTSAETLVTESFDTTETDNAMDTSCTMSCEEYNYYPNRTSASRFCEDISTNSILYRNVFDNDLLYQYDISSKESVCLTNIYGVQFISTDYNSERIFFSGYDSIDNSDKINIYSVSKINSTPKLEIENAKGAIITSEYIYYHGIMDEFTYDISRKNISSGKVETLISPEYLCSDMTMIVVGDSLYFHNLFDIYHMNTVSRELTNITNGVHANGLNKLQYADGYIYYYTYGEKAAIKRIPISKMSMDNEETILEFNNGDFWYDNLLVVDNSLIFTGRQASPLSDGESEENFLRGTFKYSIPNNTVEKIYENSLGPTCYVTHDYIISIQNAEDTRTDTIIIIDFEGNDLSPSFPGLIH